MSNASNDYIRRTKYWHINGLRLRVHGPLRQKHTEEFWDFTRNFSLVCCISSAFVTKQDGRIRMKTNENPEVETLFFEHYLFVE